MKNNEISDLLSVDRMFLSRKCTRDDGVLLWMLRQCLFYEHRISKLDKNKIIELMAELVRPQFKMHKGVTGLILSGKFKLFDDAIHDYCMGFYKQSPQYIRGVVYE